MIYFFYDISLQFLFWFYWVAWTAIFAVDWEWREGKIEGTFEGKACRMWLERWNEGSLQVSFRTELIELYCVYVELNVFISVISIVVLLVLGFFGLYGWFLDSRFSFRCCLCSLYFHLRREEIAFFFIQNGYLESWNFLGLKLRLAITIPVKKERQKWFLLASASAWIMRHLQDLLCFRLTETILHYIPNQIVRFWCQ